MKKIISGISAAAILPSAVVFTGAPSIAAEAPVLKNDSKLIITKDGSAVCGTGGSITVAELAEAIIAAQAQ